MSRTESRQIRYVFSGVNRVSGVARAVGRSLGGVKRIAGQMNAIGVASVNAARGVGRVLAPLGALSGLAGGLAVNKSVQDFVRLGDQAAKTARQLNMSTSAYTELNYWAERNGLKTEEWATAQRALSSRLARAAGGENEKFASLLQRLNIQMRDAQGNTRSMDAVLLDLAAAFEANEDPAMRTLIATQAFGEEMGVRMVDALSQGEDSMVALRKAARELGISLSDEDGKAAEAFADKQTNLAAAVQGVAFAIGRELLPTLGPLIDKLSGWIAANREVVATEVGKVVRNIAASLESFDWAGFADTVGNIGTGVANLAEWMGGWENAALAVVAVMNGPLIMSFIGVGKEIAILGKLMLASPIGLAITGIAYAASLLIRNWDGVAAWFGEMWGSIVQYFQGAYDLIAGILTLDFERAFGGLKDMLSGFASFWDGIFEGIAETARAVIGDVTSVVESVTGVVSGVMGFFGGDDDEEEGEGGRRPPAGPRANPHPALAARPRDEAGDGPSPDEAGRESLVGRAARAGAARNGAASGASSLGDVIVTLNITGRDVEVEGGVEAPQGSRRIQGYNLAGGLN